MPLLRLGPPSLASWQTFIFFRQALISSFISPLLALISSFRLVSVFFLRGLCPGSVDIHPEDESTLKDLKLLVIGLYLGFHPFLQGLHFFSPGLHLF
jgi:hypothetical protein